MDKNAKAWILMHVAYKTEFQNSLKALNSGNVIAGPIPFPSITELPPGQRFFSRRDASTQSLTATPITHNF